jgi:hypothetical protein
MDETLAVLAMIPFIGYFFRKLHAWYHAKLGHTCHEKHCDDTHVEHAYSPFARSCKGYQQVSDADMEYLRGTPAPLHIKVPVTIWDPISQDDVSERYGNDLVVFLYKELADIGILEVSKEEVHWYVNDRAELWVQVHGKNLFHDQYTCEWGWRIG